MDFNISLKFSVAKGATSVSTLDGKTIVRGGSTLKMYSHKSSSVEEEMENDADNELEDAELGSDFLSGTFTRCLFRLTFNPRKLKTLMHPSELLEIVIFHFFISGKGQLHQHFHHWEVE